MTKLNEYIEDLNMIISKIKNNEKIKLNLIILLPLLYYMKSSNVINQEEFKMIINNKTLKIKELKYFKFNEFQRKPEKIEEYLSEFIDESINLLQNDIDYQSVYFVLYEILINVYKHSKFNNAYPTNHNT